MQRNVLKILSGLILLSLITLGFVYREHISVSTLQHWIEQAGIWGPIAFIVIYVIATVLFIPGSLLTLAAGAIFGPWLGGIYALAGATIGASLAFLLARFLMADWARKKTSGTLEKLTTGIDEEGWRFVAFVRLVPIFPFNVLNYALGLTRIPFMAYALTSFICMAPATVAYTWLGFAGREAVSGSKDNVQNIIIALALLAAVIFLPRFIKRLRGSSSAKS
ncbi:MAG: TVP38/TMEM64 family protein [Gammaproteobacteria bacterium]|nr:TVP38/TMEM64 family protein [Gammaproteobacteria bacterium]